MDPVYEQKLRDEVIYLHSLWHQGPPSSSSSSTRHSLKHNQSTHFKNNKPKTTQFPNEWSSPPPPPTHSPKPENSKTSSSKNAQQNAITATHKFLLQNTHADDDEDMVDSEDEKEEFMLEESKDFFQELFTDDVELRDYYVKNFIQGEFCCFVCGAVGGKGMGKRFKSCLALVQHSITVSKTKRRKAHRAFAKTVCKVLGWDIDQLPATVSLLSECKPGEEEQVIVDLANKESSRETSDVIVSLSSENVSEDAQGNANFDKNEDLVTYTGNVEVVEGDNHGVLQESGGVYGLSEHTSDNDANHDVSMLIEHILEENEIMAESGDVVSTLNTQTSNNKDISGRSLESGAIVSVLHEHVSEDNGLVQERGATVSLLNENASDNNSGIVPESGTVVSMLKNEGTSDNSGGVVKGDGEERLSGEAHAVSFEKGSPVTSFCNLNSVEGNGGGVARESGAMETDYQENVNTLTNPDVVITQPNNPEEPAAEDLIIAAATDEKNGVGNEML